MQLITILLIVVGILATLSGIIVFLGSTKTNRVRSAWYCLAAISAAIWSISIANLYLCKSDIDGVASFHTNWTFVSAIMLDAAFLGFSAWNIKYGKPVTIFFFLAGLALSSVIIAHPEWLYSGIVFTNSGNGPILTIGPLFFTYGAYFGIMVPLISLAFLRQFLRARSKRNRISNLLALIAYIIASTIILITDFILLLLQNWSMGWLGPLAVAFVVLMIYYLVLRYRVINLSLRWLKFFSYIIIIASIAIVYMIIFSIVFAALFRGSTPSIEVIALNFIMILIFLALIPAMNGLITFIRRLLLSQNSKPSTTHIKTPSSHPTTHHSTSAHHTKTITNQGAKPHDRA